jgi:hypothetical protein
MDFELQQTLIARAKRERAETVAALAGAAAKVLRRQALRLQRAWTSARARTAPQR